MKYLLIILGALLVITSFLFVLAIPSTAQALPEYSAQTGEPCFSCHNSPSGGGPRGPRGLAWVASEKPGVIPDLMESLELLGVKLTVDETYFTEVTSQIQEAEILEVSPAQTYKLFQWLSLYDGN
jgi:hypothetical protein